MVWALHTCRNMRIPVLPSLLVLGVLGGSAHAERDKRTSTRAVTDVADRLNAERFARSLSGALGITGAARAEEPTTVAAIRDVDPLTRLAPPVVPREPYLAAADISALVAPHGAQIERCYVEAIGDLRRAGRLDLTFAIARQGTVLSVKATAPGLAGKSLRKLEGCVRASVDTVQFPERRHDTTAVVPYFFQHTDAPDAGPQLSCWNPKGC